MISSLLAAVDSSTYALSVQEQAIALGTACRARITGLYVLDVRYLEMPPYVDYAYTFDAAPAAAVAEKMMEGFRAKSGRLLSDLSGAAVAAGLAVETRAEEGVPGQVIAELARSHDLVIMGKRGEHAKWGRGLLGSTAESVARRSATPVLLLEPAYRPLEKALVLFDGSAAATRALKLAADLAVRTGTAVVVFTADDDAERGRATQAAAEAYLGPLGLDAEYLLTGGRAAKTVSAVLANDPPDVVVMGTRGHSALHDLILGSTAEHLMRSVGLPVLLVP